MGENGNLEAHVGSVESVNTVASTSHEERDAATIPHVDGALTDEEPLDAGSRPATPRFLQDQRSWKHWQWVPFPVRRLVQAGVVWVQGPADPRDHKIRPVFPAVQEAPLRLLDRFVPRALHRFLLLCGFLLAWLVTFALVTRSGQSATEIPGWGAPVDIGCGDSYWSPGNGCGIDGDDCRPFNGTGFAFRCPASCLSYQILNFRAVGSQEVIYRPLVIGGPGTNGSDSDSPAVYRADSFLCGAALHAGLFPDATGGCGVVNLVGTHSDFASTTRNGIDSIGFDSYFPRTFAFEEGIQCSSTDSRWKLLAVSVVFTTVLSLFTTSPAIFFFACFTMIYWTVGMATDAPSFSDIPDLFSNELGNFLPAALAAWVMYDKMGVRRTLLGLRAQVEKTVLWLGACWVGALTNYTFDFIPIQRLTAHDLQQQPGGIAALVVIVVVVLVVVVSQVWYFRQEGRLVRYLKLYALFLGGIVVCLVLPDLSLRIHHYILALLLLPGTSMQTRPSLVYQGLLMGFFLDGIARWGWDSFLQTAVQLQGDAPSGSFLPSILPPVIALGASAAANLSSSLSSSSSSSSITFQWQSPPTPAQDGISVLVNDVERFRTYFHDEIDPAANFTWTRSGGGQAAMDEYFRFAWMEGSSSDDYTMAGTWTADGEWIDMLPGPSRVRSRGVEGGDERMVPAGRRK